MNNIEQCKQKLENTQISVYTPAPTLMFALTEDKVLVITSFHTFFLRHTHRNYIPRLNRIRGMIETNQIHNPADLISELKLNVGQGVEMVVTDLNWHIGTKK